MEIINTENLNEARKEIKKLSKENKKVIVNAKDYEFNRKMFEDKDIDFIINLEETEKDHLKQRNSGLNEVLARFAKKNDITIGINIENIKNKSKLEKAKSISRIIQNVKICKRIKNKIALFPEDYNKLDSISFFKAIGGSTEQIINR